MTSQPFSGVLFPVPRGEDEPKFSALRNRAVRAVAAGHECGFSLDYIPR